MKKSQKPNSQLSSLRIIIVRFAFIFILISSFNAGAQSTCLGGLNYGTYGGTYQFNSPKTFSTNWPTNTNTISFNGTIEFNADVIIDKAHIVMGDDAKIIVQNGKTLTITDSWF